MNTPLLTRTALTRTRLGVAIAIVALCLARPGAAFPPAPHHVIYGTVRDEFGNPLTGDNVQIVLEATSGLQIRGSVIPNLEPGINYRLSIPMDSGATSVPYAPHALRPMIPFQIKVQIGSDTYLPIEMTGDFASLGDPAKKTRIDLTLGEDLDRDGLPDAWERMVLHLLGGTIDLDDIAPGGDLDHDGLSNLKEYIAGTYAHDPEEGFALEIAGFGEEGPWLEFLAIRGRNYTIFGSTDLTNWSAVPFRLSTENATATPRSNYYARDSRVIRVEAMPGSAENLKFFKLHVN